MKPASTASIQAMGAPRLIEPLPAHRLDEARLFAYLMHHIGDMGDPVRVRQFQGGQSNPTFLIEFTGGHCVLRKKPPGALLPSAHQVDREYRVQAALATCGFPVARMLHYCADTSFVGTEFYVMEFLQGRVFTDFRASSLSHADRAQVQMAMFETIATLHGIDYEAAGLTGFARPDNYVARQLKRFGQQYTEVATEHLPAMTALIKWLEEHMPADTAASIVHGDFRLANIMLHPTEPRIVAVLDWELSTLGHPLADLAYTCLCFHMPHNTEPDYAGYAGVDLAALGMLGQAECLDIYRQRSGRATLNNWKFHLGFALFRSAAILEGVYARALAGNAVDTRAVRFHAMARMTAELGLEIVERGGP
jgi:aminoglycoside phosphotransferase (APT) family kinase protein